MKTLLVTVSLLFTMSFAGNTPPAPQNGEGPGARIDTARMPPALHRDSLRLPELPDSLKTKMEQRNQEFDAKRVELSKDSAKHDGAKGSVDSLRKTWEAKRDTQVAHIKDPVVRAKVEARIEKVSEQKAAVKAKVDAKRAKIEAKKPVKPEAPVTK